MPPAPCVQVQVAFRRVNRHPVAKKAVHLKRHVIRNVGMGLVPDALNEIAFHHAQIDIPEAFHIVQDTAVNAFLTSLFVVAKIVL